MHCSIDIELVDKIAEITEKCFAAVNELIHMIATTKNGTFFQDFYQKAGQAHKDCETAREAVEKTQGRTRQANSTAKHAL